MKRLFLAISLASVCASVNAQQVLADGYYRAQNTRTERYCLLADDYAYVDKSISGAGTGSVYLQAIRTYRPFERVAYEPGSIIKFTYSQSGKGYTLAAQGTDTYTMLKNYGNYYLTVAWNSRGRGYTAAASAQGFNIRLTDESLDTDGQFSEKWDTLGFMQPTGSQNYSYWRITPVDATTDNYFGFKPTLSVNGKYYLPFYAGFGFTKYSNGIRAYYVDRVNEGKGVAELREITDNNLPAGFPMIIETSNADPTNNRVNVTDGGNVPNDNKLTGVYFCSAKELLPSYDQPGAHHEDVYTLNDPSTMRLLAVDNGQLVLKKSSAKFIPANSFYLKVSSSCPDVVRLLNVEDFTTGITSITSDKPANASNDVYNLNGQRVSTTGLDNLPQGIYIYNGKKVVKN